MMTKNKSFSSVIKTFFINLIFTFTAVVLFVLAHPNVVFNKGLFFLGFLIYVPVLLCVHYSDFKTVWLQGFIFGTFSYGIYSYWIKVSYPEFLPVVFAGYGIIFALLFLLLKFTDKIFKKNGWVISWLLICSAEYLKTLGFLGLSYGVTAYTQWTNVYFIQICDVIGVYGLNAVVILFSAVVYSLIQKTADRKFMVLKSEKNIHNNQTAFSKFIQNQDLYESYSKKTSWISLGVWGIVFVFCYIYGYVKVTDNTENQTVTVTAIQNNENSWLDGIEVYTKNIYKLISLTEEALEFNSQIDLVVWPETSVVPAIVANYYSPVDERRKAVVDYLLNYMNSKNCGFIIGNGHKTIGKNGETELYNSALYFTPGKNVLPPEPENYAKIKLVPFTEYFPYKKQFPAIYNSLKKRNLLNWNKGTDVKVFTYGSLNFSSLICFEDTFPELARTEYKKGSRCFISLANDSWSKSQVCQNQHLAIALFRSVENHVPSVRSTASGNTCIIDSNGRITDMCPAFCEDFVIGKIPVVAKGRKMTVYCKIGDVAGIAACVASVLLLIIQLINVIINKNRTIKV